MSIIVNPCAYKTQSCINFDKVDDLMIQLVNDHYFDLQMFANFVLDIDNNRYQQKNFVQKILAVQQQYNPQYPNMSLFTPQNMSKLKNLVDTILNRIPQNHITASDYLRNIANYSFFGGGALSPTILLRINKKIPGQPNAVMPLVVKFVPLQFLYYPNNLSESRAKIFTETYVEAPSYAIYLKEAWMYCFTQNHLTKYTPTFNCISDCYIIKGFPFSNLNDLRKIYASYEQDLIRKKKSIPFKRWFNLLIKTNTNKSISDTILSSEFGCFEMKEIQGTLDDLIKVGRQFNLSILFEYLYGKMIAAYIGKIILTDDHFGNVGFITVDYYREYNIICNGCKFTFYMPPGRMIQFIDLERYVFNFSQYDIYTNTALKQIPNKDFSNASHHLADINNEYIFNRYIFDKTIATFLNPKFNSNQFYYPMEHQIMLLILKSPFVHDIKTFCSIMDANLPVNYKTKPSTGRIASYTINLDDESIKIINNKRVSDNI